MPELADVERFRRVLTEHALDQPVRHVAVPDPALLHGTDPQGLGRALRGRCVASPRRHGKWLIAPTDGEPVVIWHFRMTGELRWSQPGMAHPHDRAVVSFDHGELRYRDPRRLGRMWLARGPDRVPDVTGPLGPDASEVDRDRLGAILAGSTATLKSSLMSQRHIAGLGNELSDEILWRARLHPGRRARTTCPDDADGLYAAMRRVLDDSVRAGRIPEEPGWLNGQRGQRHPRCPRCDTGLETGRVAGRTNYRCPRCQPW